MASNETYLFKEASTPEEFFAIARLNHQIFVEEVGQHPATETGSLVDPFSAKSDYFIAKRDDLLVGMVAVHDRPPFSVAAKMPDPSRLDALGPRLLEVRLLAIQPAHRRSRVFAGLLYAVLTRAVTQNHTHLLISAVDAQRTLYERLGFCSLGPPVQRGRAFFTPMALEVQSLCPVTVNRFRKWATGTNPVALLPGPVQASTLVKRAFALPLISHRSKAFIDDFEDIRNRLQNLSGGLRTALFPGSGTLANDVVGAAIAADRSRQKGLVLVNGEFGDRLANHARRWRLPHDVLRWEWTESWDLDRVRLLLDRDSAINWIWAVHLETSTGRLNDLCGLRQLVQGRSIDLYLDCVSSFGAIEPHLEAVSLATTVSGKSLGAYAGVAAVFVAEPERFDSKSFPPSLDLPATVKAVGPLTTFASPVIRALREALKTQDTKKWRCYAAQGEWVRNRLTEIGLHPLVRGKDAAPVITTFSPRAGECSLSVLKRCAMAGFLIAGESDYLIKRNILQIASMGDVQVDQLEPLFAVL
jgi:aspartate aminotransferase-like enzyme